MDNNDKRSTSWASDGVTPQSSHSYNFLLRMSRMLGEVATRSSQTVDAQSLLLEHQIKLPAAERLFGNAIHRIRRTRRPIAGEANSKDLQKIVARSHETLISANTVFPMTLFPDTVTVDRTKVTITKRDFFWSSDVMSIRIEDVLNVSVSVGPLFGSITIASRVMSTIDHFQISHFWRNDAIKLKHIIQGYVIAQHNRIDTAHLNKKELIETLTGLGLDSNR